MAFRLATLAGRVDVDNMLAEMEPGQFDEWEAYWKVEPFGDWWRAAAMIASAFCGAEIEELMPSGSLMNPYRANDPNTAEQEAAVRYGDSGNHSG